MALVSMELTEEEAAQIQRQRQEAEKTKWIDEGWWQAADYLVRFGDQCCGGDGMGFNPETQKRWGQSYYDMAQLLNEEAKRRYKR